MPNISHLSSGSPGFTSPSSAETPVDGGTEVRSRTPTTEPYPLPEKPEFLKRMQSAAAAPPRQTLGQRLIKLAEANVDTLRSALKLSKAASDLAQRNRRLTPSHTVSLCSAQSKYEKAKAHLEKLLKQETEKEAQTRPARLKSEEALRTVDGQFAAFDRQQGPAELTVASGTPNGSSQAAIATPTPPADRGTGPTSQNMHPRDGAIVQQALNQLMSPAGPAGGLSTGLPASATFVASASSSPRRQPQNQAGSPANRPVTESPVPVLPARGLGRPAQPFSGEGDLLDYIKEMESAQETPMAELFGDLIEIGTFLQLRPYILNAFRNGVAWRTNDSQTRSNAITAMEIQLIAAVRQNLDPRVQSKVLETIADHVNELRTSADEPYNLEEENPRPFIKHRV